MRAAVVTAILFVGALAGRAGGSDAPMVSGPVEGGERGRPFTSATFDLSAHGYVEEEYFLEGVAITYEAAPGTALESDGHWRVVASGRLPYRTRILVRRPVDRSAFDGTVRLSQANLASLAGTTRPTVNRVLQELVKDETVRLRRARIEVLDSEALAARTPDL